MARYEYAQKPRTCPHCSSTKIVTIQYGLVCPDEEAERIGKVRYGGCMISDNNPVWQCTHCETVLYRQAR